MAAYEDKVLSKESAIFRANQMIAQGEKLRNAANQVAAAKTTAQHDAAHSVKENELLSYRTWTVPDQLIPVMKALIEAAS